MRVNDISNPKKKKKHRTLHKNSMQKKSKYGFVLTRRNKKMSINVPTLKLPHFTKQKGQEKSSVTASQISNALFKIRKK